MRLVPQHDPGFRVCCGVDGCKNTYRKFSSLNSHVYTYHKSRLQQTCIPVSTPAFSGTDNEQDDPMDRTDINSSGVTETAGNSNESDLLMDTLIALIVKMSYCKTRSKVCILY